MPFGSGIGGYYPFAVEYLALWSELAGQFLISYRNDINTSVTEFALISPGGNGSSAGIPIAYALASQSDIQLNLLAKLSNGSGLHAGDAVTITQFKLALA
jgi:hypothetical protein